MHRLLLLPLYLVRLGDDHMCLSDEWKKRTDCCEDEALVSAISLGAGEEKEGLVEAMKEKRR
eukprot:12931452-Prorocentrum_lima.AAC.1